MAALADALGDGAPVLPLPPGTEPSDVEALLDAPLPAETALVIRTSGSTGVPKAVALSASSLLASARFTHEALGGPGGWLVTLPSHLISGAQMLVRSVVSGIDPVFLDGHFDPASLVHTAERMSAERRYVSLVPVQFSRLLDLAEQDPDAADTLRRFDAVLVGGQAVSLELRRRAHDLGVALRRSYGMTETSGGCVYDGVEIGDTRVRIRGGEVQLAGSTLALGYVDAPEAIADRFIEECGRDGEMTRWYRTGDAGELLGGMLTVTGRLDRVLVSGGVNVSLDRIEEVAREQRGWESAIALATPHPEWGQRPTLVIETVADAVPFDDVQAAIRDRLGPAAVPEWANEMAEIPRLLGGKPDLIAVEAWVQQLRQSFREIRDAETGSRRTDAHTVHREDHA
ncbi:AMP-binding protein [Leucobacter insecticola]|uniref:AMP-binding protein n=1 Tax=Leucobacter insecticola TaxID=2714934 RepID=A0A6G8FLS5_9MICO|nr:AMP-binding protein [Leucobacter insecticola]